MKTEKEFEKNEILPFSLDEFDSDNNNFSLLYTNIGESKKLLESYETFINKYFVSINLYFKELTEFNSNFLVEDKFKSSVINSPIFQLGKAIKKAVQAQIDNLFSIISNQRIFFAFIEALSNLSKILQESPAKFSINSSNNNGPNDHIKPVVISLMKTFEEIESKITDEYICKKYNKHILGINERPLKDNIEQAKFLEKTFLVFEEDIKKQLLNDFQEMEKKTTSIFNEMKNIVKNIVDILRTNNSTYLEELQNEIDLIGKIPKNTSRSLNCSYVSAQNNEPEIGIKNEDNLDMFQYNIKIIHNPKIQVIDSIKNTNEEENKELTDNKIYQDKKEENSIENKIINDDDKNDKIKEKNKNVIFPNIFKEYKQKEKEEIYNYTELNLTEEDIYNIVSILYSYDFKMLNKTEYDLNIEKEKIKVSNVAKKLFTFDAENSINEKITDEEVNNLYKLLKDRETLMQFFVMLNNYRATGRYEATKRSFGIIVNIFNKVQDYLLKNRDVILEGLILILSQTFYIIKDKKKIYIQHEIKEHPLFKKEDYWKNYLNETIDEEIEKMKKEEKKSNKVISKEKHQQKINEHILSKIVPLTSYMNDFGLQEDIIMNIVNNIFDKYNIDEDGKTMILSSLEK